MMQIKSREWGTSRKIKACNKVSITTKFFQKADLPSTKNWLHGVVFQEITDEKDRLKVFLNI